MDVEGRRLVKNDSNIHRSVTGGPGDAIQSLNTIFLRFMPSAKNFVLSEFESGQLEVTQTFMFLRHACTLTNCCVSSGFMDR